MAWRLLADRHVAADGRLGHLGVVLVDQALPDPPGRVALLLRERRRSSASQPSMIGFQGPSAGAGRSPCLRGGGIGEASASRTVRRCTPKCSASARIDSSSRSWDFLICS